MRGISSGHRSERVVVRMTPEEKAKVRELADLEGLPVGEFLLQTVLDIEDRITTLAAELDESMARVASALDEGGEASRRREAGRAKEEEGIRAKVRRELSDLDIEALVDRIVGKPRF